MCETHYERHRLGRDVFAPLGPKKTIRRYNRLELCERPHCTRKPYALGLCVAHYKRRERGALLDTPIRTPKRARLGKGRWLTGEGYILRVVEPTTPGSWVWSGYCVILEHRLIIQNRLGRPLLRSEQVHHRDGDKLNNDPSNLELKSGPHGSGILVKDGINASVNYLIRYAKLTTSQRASLSEIQEGLWE